MDQNSLDAKQLELVNVVKSMLSGDMNLIEGARQICALRHDIGDPDNDVFLAIRAIESETDHFPLGPMRLGCSQEYIERADAEIESYLQEAREDILQACKAILQVYQ